MKNLKKVLALVLMCVMVVSSFTTTYAAEGAKTDAEIAESLNMLRGDGQGVTAEYLAKETTRLQAAIMFLRLKGLEVEAMYHTGTDNFADANEVQWAGGRTILAYLKAHPELGWVGNGKGFAPNQTITAQAYYKVMLEALGYKQGVHFEWTNVLSFAANKGLVSVANVKPFRNSHIATATVETLKAENSTGVRLIDALVEAKVIDKEIAVLLGPAPSKGMMTEATAIDATTIKITFDQTVIPESDDFTIRNSNGYQLPASTVADVSLADDGKVTILKINELTVGSKYTITFGDVSKVIVPTIKDDKTKPMITSAEAITGALLRVVIGTRNVNQDSLVASNFSIDNGAGVYDVNLDHEEMKKDGNENETILLLNVSGLKTGKAFTVKSSNVRSYEGAVADNGESKAIFAGKDADKQAPKLAGAVSEAGYKVIVTFTEDAQLDVASATDISNYTITPDIAITDAKIDKNVIGGDTTVILTTTYQKSGIAYTLKASNISDGTNIMKDTEKTVFAGKDKANNQTAVGAVALDATKVEVTLGYEANDTALNINNYSINNDIEVTAAEFKEDVDKAEKIDRKKVILTTTKMKSGLAYTVTVKTGVQDTLGQGLKDSKKLIYAGKDPDVSFTTSNVAKALNINKIQVEFGEVVDRATARNVANYHISDLGYPSTVTLDSEGKIATLTVQDQKAGKAYILTLNNIKDRAGNVIKSDTKLTFTGRGEITDRLKMTSVIALSETKIKVNLNEPINTGSIDLSKFHLESISSSESYSIVGATPSTTENYIILIVGTNKLTASKVYSLTIANDSNLVGKYTAHTFATTKEADRKSLFVGSDADTPQFSIDYVTALDKTHIKVRLTEPLSNSATGHTSKLSIFADDDYSTKALDKNGSVIAFEESLTPVIADNRYSVIYQLPRELNDSKVYYLQFNDLSNFVSSTAVLAPYKEGASTARKIFVTGNLVTASETKLDMTSAYMVDKNTIEVKFNVDTKRDLTKNEVIIVNNPSDNSNPSGLEVGYVEFTNERTARIYFTGHEKLNNSNGIHYVKITGSLTTLVGSSTSFGTDKHYETFAKNPIDNAKPTIALVEPQTSKVLKITLSEKAYKNNTRALMDNNDFIIYNNDTNIVIDPSKITVTPVSNNDVNKVFYLGLDDGVFLSGANYQIGLAGNVIGVDGYVSADAYVPTSNETSNSRHFGGATSSVTKLTLTDTANNLLITGGTDSQDDKLEIKTGLGLNASTDYIIGFSGGNSSLAVSKMKLATTASKTFAETVITGQNQKAITGQTTNVMFYDTAGNKMLDNAVAITLIAGSPVYQSASIDGTHKIVTLTFDENIVNATGSAAALKAAVAIATNGTTYNALGASDSVSILDNKLIVTFGNVLTTATNKIKIAENTLKDTDNNLVGTEIVTEAIDASADIVAPVYQSVTLNETRTAATLTFDETIVNAKATDAEMKAAVTIATDGVAYNALQSNDIVAISNNTLVITFENALTTATNKIKVDLDTLKDGSGNKLSTQIITDAIDAAVPVYQGISKDSLRKVVTLTFDENIANATASDAELKTAIKIATDGSIYNALQTNDSVSISNNTLVITFENALTTATNKIRVEANTLKDLAGNKITAPIITDTIDAAVPVYQGAATDVMRKVVTLTFDENIANATASDADLKAAITIATDGSTYTQLLMNDSVSISNNTLVITFENALTTATNKIKVATGTLKDESDNVLPEIITDAIDAAVPVYQSVAKDATSKVVTLTFDEDIVNATASDAALKAAIQIATDGVAYNDLQTNDSVRISGKTLEITFENALTTATNKIKVNGFALKDGANNVLSAPIITEEIDAAPPAYQSVGIDAPKKVVTLTFDENIYDATILPATLKSSIEIATDGVNFVPLQLNDTVAIVDKTLIITFENALTTATNKIKVKENTLKDLKNNVQKTETITDVVDAS